MSLCQFGKGCFGCCGDDFKSKQEVLKEINDNIAEFRRYNNKKDFMRRPPYFKPSGICGNLGFINGRIGCLVYPKKRGADIRRGYCDYNFECKTLKEFNSWSAKRQESFLNFLKKKNIDFYDYSINMDNGKLLEEFKASEESWKAVMQRTLVQK